MDAAQKLLKQIAILTTAVLLLSTVGLAATLVVPVTTVSIGAGGYVDASVTSSDATVITYVVGLPAYSGGDPAWLTVSPTGSTDTAATAGLRFTAHSVGLSAAVHSATVTLTPTAGATASVTITVTWDTSGGGGGTTTTLSASKTTVNLTSTLLADTVTITNLSTSLITMTWAAATTSGGNWLTATLTPTTIQPNSSATLSVAGASAGLSAGNYQGSVTVTPSDGTKALTITVNFAVGNVGNGTWTVYPNSVAWSFITNSGTYPYQTVTVTTTSGLANYSVSTTQTGTVHWLLVAANGQPAAYNQGGVPVNVGFTLSVGTAADGLTQGSYTDQAILSDSNGAQQAIITVTLNVNGGGGTSPGLVISPSSVPLTSAVNGAQQSQVVSVTSSTGGTLVVSGCAYASWLTCTLPNNTAVSPNIPINFTINANPAGLTANTYTSTMQIQVGSQTGNLNISLVVGGGGTNSAVVAPAATRRGLELKHSLLLDLPAMVVGDPQRLRQVLLNLLSNAVKFTERGHVAVEASLAGRDGGQAALTWGPGEDGGAWIQVSDNGRGIPRKVQKRIFEPFFSYGKARGTGLGMATVQRIMAEHQGSIELASEEGQGTTITLRLPGPPAGTSAHDTGEFPIQQGGPCG